MFLDIRIFLSGMREPYRPQMKTQQEVLLNQAAYWESKRQCSLMQNGPTEQNIRDDYESLGVEMLKDTIVFCREAVGDITVRKLNSNKLPDFDTYNIANMDDLLRHFEFSNGIPRHKKQELLSKIRAEFVRKGLFLTDCDSKFSHTNVLNIEGNEFQIMNFRTRTPILYKNGKKIPLNTIDLEKILNYEM